MKKSFAMAAALAMAFSAVAANTYAEGETKVYVTVSDSNSALVLTQEPVNVTDIDGDGKLTVNDALYIAHEENYEGGAAAGYKTSVGQYGLGLDVLWGKENKQSFGYYVNSKMANGLTDEIKDGDYVDALTFPDPSDLDYHYSWFDAREGEGDPDKEVTLQLKALSFDASWAPVENPVEGAKITINGNETDFVTDADGKAVVKFTEAGRNVVSAKGGNIKIAPPSYVMQISGEAASTTSTTTTTTTTTTSTTTSTAATSASAKTTAKASTTAKATTTSKNNSPKTGDSGAAVALVSLGAAAAAAFALRRRNEK
ncbi:MAG: NPXTG-anchored protein [Ruminococcus sp.]|uniref:NPXTG-anchored protein n=1 Tax=Ruminococcus sp. TaxID=41978 RepID=UPI0025FC5388|nr:NPXTG-anchored protein [Ruminococcus sp.]MBR6995152.1 NPXTG-anchored protein [Ruminococcus sp.]